MSDNINNLRQIINSLPEQSTTQAAQFSSSLRKDASWAPIVPIGHTSYTWTGKDFHQPHEASIILGSVKPGDQPIEAAPVKHSIPTPGPAIDINPVEQQVVAAKVEKAKAAATVTQTAASAGNATLDHLSQLDFVVGKIVECKKHENADSLYVEQIDVGTDRNGVRQIVSGLVKFLTLEEMIGSMCIVVANLKAAPLRGVVSHGMVLAASDAERTKVVLCQPPAGAKPGDRIIPIIDGVEFAAPVPEVNPKKKNSVWSIVAPELKTNEKGEVVFGDGYVLGTSNGAATASINNATVS